MTMEMLSPIHVAPHPLLRPLAFTTVFPTPLGNRETPGEILALLSHEVETPISREESHRMAVRDMLRHWGHKPAGRGKPAAEYLIRAVDQGALGSINLAVDICNVVSLHSGHSIALVDLDKAHPPFRVDQGPEEGRYVFNASGQEMALKGIICLWDAHGPCGNPVKDAQRVKTDENTSRTLTVIWGVTGFQDRLDLAFRWYRDLLERQGARVQEIPVVLEGPEG
jgi:DNA/RNA-binding domain of Phe-tRNA-synthetase-like protein